METNKPKKFKKVYILFGFIFIFLYVFVVMVKANGTFYFRVLDDAIVNPDKYSSVNPDTVNLQLLYNDLNTMNDRLHNDFDYMEYFEQPVEQEGIFKLPMEFADGYLQSNGKDDYSNQEIESDTGTITETPLNAIQIDSKAETTFDFQIYEGRDFNVEDFNYQDTIPIVLGYDFSDYYNVGDTIEFYYLDRKFEASVVGFLADNETIPSEFQLSYPNLNTYIVMPFEKINLDDISESDYLGPFPPGITDNNRYFLCLYYLDKNNGYIISNNELNYQSVKHKVENESKDLV